jgi:hypothetical protein
MPRWQGLPCLWAMIGLFFGPLVLYSLLTNRIAGEEAMDLIQSVIERTIEKLYEDERLRSNLSDDEAKIVLSWAESWLTTQISAAESENRARQIAQNEWARVRQAVSIINSLAEQPGTLRLSQALAAFEPQMQGAATWPRTTVLQLLTEFITTLWRTERTKAMPGGSQ